MAMHDASQMDTRATKKLKRRSRKSAEIQPNTATISPANEVSSNISSDDAPILVQRYAALADALEANKPVCEALREAGWPESRARNGWAEVPKRVIEVILLRQRHANFGDVLKHLPELTESSVVGKMYHDMMHNEKDGVPAAKVLTQHTSISSKFVQEQRNNVLIIQAPSDWRPQEDAHTPEPEPERVQGHKTIDALPFPEYE